MLAQGYTFVDSSRAGAKLGLEFLGVAEIRLSALVWGLIDADLQEFNGYLTVESKGKRRPTDRHLDSFLWRVYPINSGRAPRRGDKQPEEKHHTNRSFPHREVLQARSQSHPLPLIILRVGSSHAGARLASRLFEVFNDLAGNVTSAGQVRE
jgi:hypothetical protein